MSNGWTWSYEDLSGAPVTGDALVSSAFPTQSDAETWLGAQWQDLAASGVAAVTLHEHGVAVYGPMPLADGS